jgi:hypothetical protein
MARGVLIRTRKVGRVRTVELVPDRLCVAEFWLAAQQHLSEGRLGRLDQFVIQQKKGSRP